MDILNQINKILDEIDVEFKQMSIPILNNDGSITVVIKDRGDEKIYVLQLRAVKSTLKVDPLKEAISLTQSDADFIKGLESKFKL